MLPESGILTKQPKNGFSEDFICAYEIRAPETAAEGSYIYFYPMTLTDTSAQLTIAESITSPDVVTCSVHEGEMIAARVPSKFFVSFRSQNTDSARFFFQASYSDSSLETNLANSARCSDLGASIPESITPTTDDAGSTYFRVATDVERATLMAYLT